MGMVQPDDFQWGVVTTCLPLNWTQLAFQLVPAELQLVTVESQVGPVDPRF